MPASQQFRQALSSVAGGTTNTFSGVTLGPASADRYIVVLATARISATTLDYTISSTIAGITATNVLSHVSLSASAHRQTTFIAQVPTGTTGDVVLTFSRSITRSMISVFSATGLDGLTPHATAVSTAPATNVASQTLTIPAEGIAIAGGYNIIGSAYTWTGLTERHDDVFSSSNYFSAAGDDFASLQTSRVITATWGGTSGFQPMHSFLSWAPSSGGGVIPSNYRRNHPLIGV